MVSRKVEKEASFTEISSTASMELLVHFMKNDNI